MAETASDTVACWNIVLIVVAVIGGIISLVTPIVIPVLVVDSAGEFYRDAERS
ncbi:MAG: hypothetical protein V8S01_12160 [Dorea sp.]